MGIIFIFIFFIYLTVSGVILFITRKLTRSKKIFFAVALLLVIFPIRRLIFYDVIFAYYRLSPLQEIRKTVERPISVYWEDNVWPGFDEYGRHWMVKNYLDGDHLQVLALNGDDGKIYLYRAKRDDFKGLAPLAGRLEQLRAKEAILQKEFGKIYRRDFLSKHKPFRFPQDMGAKEKFVKNHPLHKRIEKIDNKISSVFNNIYHLKRLGWERIFSTVKIYGKASGLPPINYKISLNLLQKDFLVNNGKKELYADKVRIIEIKSKDVIAYSVRYMVYADFISKISDSQPKFDDGLGDMGPYEFDDKVIFKYTKSGSPYDIEREHKLISKID